MKPFSLCVLIAAVIFFSSCAYDKKTEVFEGTPTERELHSIIKKSGAQYASFKKKSNYRQTYKTYRNDPLLKTASRLV